MTPELRHLLFAGIFLLGTTMAATAAPSSASPTPGSVAPCPESGEEATTPEGSKWRLLSLGEEGQEDLVRRVETAFRELGGGVLGEVEATAEDPTILTDGDVHHVIVRALEIRFDGMEGWDGDIQGLLRGQDLRVAYGPLGVREIEFVCPPRLDAVLNADIGSLMAHLVAGDFQQASLHFPGGDPDQGPEQPVLEGELDLDVLLFEWSPEIRLVGNFARDGRRFVFEPVRLRVSGAPGFLRARIRDRLYEAANEGFGLDQAMRNLQDVGIRFDEVRLQHSRKGEVVNEQQLRQR